MWGVTEWQLSWQGDLWCYRVAGVLPDSSPIPPEPVAPSAFQNLGFAVVGHEPWARASPREEDLCPSQWLHIPIRAGVSSAWQSHSPSGTVFPQHHQTA